MPIHFYKVTYALPFVSAIGLFLTLTLTNPLSAGPGGMLIVFLLSYVFCASALFVALHGGIGFITKLLSKYKKLNVREWHIGVRKAYYSASIIAFAPVLVLAMQSVGQLQLRDIVLIIVFISIAIFYVLKRS